MFAVYVYWGSLGALTTISALRSDFKRQKISKSQTGHDGNRKEIGEKSVGTRTFTDPEHPTLDISQNLDIPKLEAQTTDVMLNLDNIHETVVQNEFEFNPSFEDLSELVNYEDLLLDPGEEVVSSFIDTEEFVAENDEEFYNSEIHNNTDIYTQVSIADIEIAEQEEIMNKSEQVTEEFEETLYISDSDTWCTSENDDCKVMDDQNSESGWLDVLFKNDDEPRVDCNFVVS